MSRLKKTSIRARRRIIPSGGPAPVAVPGLPPADLKPAKKAAPRAPLIVALPGAVPPKSNDEEALDVSDIQVSKGDIDTISKKAKRKKVGPIDPAQLKALFKDVWEKHSTVETLSRDLKQAQVEHQQLLSQAYDLVGGTVLQTEDGRTFRIRPVGLDRVFVFIWETNPQHIIQV